MEPVKVGIKVFRERLAVCLLESTGTSVSFRFTLEFSLAPPEPEYVATGGQLRRSRWTDVEAFTIVNTTDEVSVTSYFVEPVVRGIFGGAEASSLGYPRDSLVGPSSRRAKGGTSLMKKTRSPFHYEPGQGD
jgi:hypothetical protein